MWSFHEGMLKKSTDRVETAGGKYAYVTLVEGHPGVVCDLLEAVVSG